MKHAAGRPGSHGVEVHRGVRLRLWVYLGSLALVFAAFALSRWDIAVLPAPVLGLGAMGLVRAWLYREEGLGGYFAVLFLGAWVALGWWAIFAAEGVTLTLLATGNAIAATISLGAFLLWVGRPR